MGQALRSDQIATLLRGEDKRNRKALLRGQRMTSQRIIQFLKHASPVFDGHFKNAWQGDETGVWNDAPYAGVIERGARPHGVNREGREAILDWARRKLGLDDKEAKAVAWAVMTKLRERGQPGLFIVRDNLEKFCAWLTLEVERALADAHKGGV